MHPSTPTPDYPTRWMIDALLSDGAAVSIRPIGPEDAPALVVFHEGLSEETAYRRFFSSKRHLTEREAEHFTHVDYRLRMAFVAVVDDALIGVGRYERAPGTDEAEVAFVVADAHQGRGLASLFLEYLAAAAGELGITRFTAETLVGNRDMLNVFRAAGFRETTTHAQGVVCVALDIRPTDTSRERAEAREWTAAARSVSRLLHPRSIAVIGAGRREGSVGNSLVRDLLRGGFRGAVYPVNPHADSIAGVPAHPTVSAIPGDVDVAIVAVPAAAAPAVVDDCAAKGVHGLIVVSSGFSETGEDGAALERRLVERAHRGGMRVIGPNCLGVITTAADVRMNATFVARAPLPGPVAFASQSGALGIAMLERAEEMGLGISGFVSMGNKVDVSSNDLLRHWEADEQTRVILLYLESFGNPRAFSRVARRVSRTKPIVAVKAGRSGAGVRDDAVDALFRRTGVIRVDTLGELLDVGAVLAHQPLPRGCRVAMVGNSGGAGILTADALVRQGLEVVEFDAALCAEVRSAAPSAVAVANPVNLGAGATADAYRRALSAVAASPRVDAVIAIHAPVPGTRAEAVADAIGSVASAADTTIVASFLGMTHPPALHRGEVRVPNFPFPEGAANALAAICLYVLWRRRPEGRITVLDGVDPEAARRLVTAELARDPDGGWLDQEALAGLLSAYGIATVPTLRAGSEAEAVAAARSLGHPVALKVVGDGIVHRTEAGGVYLGLSDEAAVRAAYVGIAHSAGAAMRGVLVQAMAPRGVEVIVGVVTDPAFGPLLMFGSGGVAVELLGDRAVSALPLTDLDVRSLVRSIRGAPLLLGYRGAPVCDTAALEDLLLRVAGLAEDVAGLAEMDLDPVIVSPAGVSVVDARARIVPRGPHAELGVRRLRPMVTSGA